MTSQIRFAGTCVNDSSIGTTAWLNPSNAEGSGFSPSVYASCPSTTGAPDSQYLFGKNFGFSIPAGATIDAIVVFIGRSTTNPDGTNPTASSVRLFKAGIPVGDDHGGGSAWPIFPTFEALLYGSDLWGTTWTAADINSADFGVGIAWTPNGSTSAIGYVNGFSVTVDYTEAAANLQPCIMEWQ